MQDIWYAMVINDHHVSRRREPLNHTKENRERRHIMNIDNLNRQFRLVFYHIYQDSKSIVSAISVLQSVRSCIFVRIHQIKVL